MILTFSVAWAGAVLDPTTVDLLGPATFVDEAWGWSAPITGEPRGRVRVWPTTSEAEAEAVFGGRSGSAADRWPGVDAARGDGWQHLVVRVGELVLEVERPQGGAFDLMSRLVRSVERQDGPRFAVPRVEAGHLGVAGDCARVAARVVAYEPGSPFANGQPVPVGACAVVVPAGACAVDVVAWDRFGRGARQAWRREGCSPAP